MAGTRGIEPWDADAMAEALVALVRELPRERLDRIQAPAQPGAYVQWLAGGSLREVFGPLVATGRYPAYHGVAHLSLRERLGRYKLAMRGTKLSPADIWVTVVPCSDTASAVFAEQCLQARLPAPMNGLGWGAKVPGSRRRGRVSPIDAVVPGRAWAPRATLMDEARARVRIASWSLRVAPGASVWPPLPAADGHARGERHLRAL